LEHHFLVFNFADPRILQLFFSLLLLACQLRIMCIEVLLNGWRA